MMGRNLFANEAKPQGRNLLPGGKQESFQDQALKLGATPGVALTPEQVEQIKRGEQITSNQPQLTQDTYMPAQTEDENAFLAAGKQEMKNIGAGIIRTFAELGNALGYENARRLLSELETSQNMDMARTDKNTEGHPIQSFAGGVTGGTLAFPVGGGSGGSVIAQILKGSAAAGAGGGLSAAGRGEDSAGIVRETAISAGFGAGAEAAPSVLKGLKKSETAKQLGSKNIGNEGVAEVVQNVDVAQNASKETGIDLLKAQQTQDIFQKEMTAFLGQNPEVSRKAAKVLSRQNKQAADAVNSLLNKIATPEQFQAAPGLGREASKRIVSNAKAERGRLTTPLYRRAFKEAKDQGYMPNIKNVTSKIDEIIEETSEAGVIRSHIDKAKKIIGDKPTLRQLQIARQEIRELAKSGKRKGDLGPTTERYLTQIQDELTESLRQFDLFAQADDEFARLSPAVDRVKNGVFGRIQDLDDKDLRRVSQMVFDVNEINNADTVRNAVKMLRGVDGGEDVARGLLRVELEKRMSKLPSSLETMLDSNVPENIPGQLRRTIFGNSKQQEMLFAALDEIDPAAGRNALWLREALDRAKSARPGGSQTGVRNMIDQELRGVGFAIRNFFRKPISSLTELSDDAAYSRKVRAVGEALYNPEWKPDMTALMKLDPNSQRAQSGFEKLLTKIAKLNSTHITTQAAGVGGRELNEEEN